MHVKSLKPPPATVQQCALIALAEYEYWRDEAGDRDLAMSAMGAAANIYAALTIGAMAPWHPKTNDRADSLDPDARCALTRYDQFPATIQELGNHNSIVHRVIQSHIAGYYITKEEALCQMIVSLAEAYRLAMDQIFQRDARSTSPVVISKSAEKEKP